MNRRLLMAGLLALAAVPATAQTVENPGTLLFTASADHAAVDLGQPIVSGYAVEFYSGSATTPAQSIDIGKPTPAATSNDISVSLTALRPKLTVPPGTYSIKVVARGPGGNAGSPASTPFSLTVRAPSAPGTPRPQAPTSSGSLRTPTSSTSR